MYWEDPVYVFRERLAGLLDALGLAARDLDGRLRLDPNDRERYVLWRDGRPTHAFHDLDNLLAGTEDAALLVVDTAKLVFTIRLWTPRQCATSSVPCAGSPPDACLS